MTDIRLQKTEKALVSMSVPISIGMLSTFLFQVVDTFFVGQLGADALAALSFSSTLYFLMVGLFMGFSVGISILVGEASGKGEASRVSSFASIGVTVAVLLSVGFSAVILLFLEPIFVLLGASSFLFPMIKAYMVPLVSGMPLLTFGMVSGGTLRAVGMVNPLEVIMAVAGVINLLFDYLLIFGVGKFPELGIQGAAVATVISWVFVVLAMTFFLVRMKLMRVSAIFKKRFLQVTRTVFQLALPTIVTQIIGLLRLCI